MRITIHSWCAPSCYCGHEMAVYVDVYNEKLRVKCQYCGLEKYTSIPFDAGTMTLRSVYDSAHSIME